MTQRQAMKKKTLAHPTGSAWICRLATTSTRTVSLIRGVYLLLDPGCALAMLITDEPTTALSATVQAQIVRLLRLLK